MTLGLPKARVYGQPKWPAIVPRAPLPPLPQPVNYHHVLNFTPPPPRTLDFYRGQFCGLQIPNAPLVPGGSSDTMMAALLDNYPRDWQKKFLLQYAQNGYSHLQRSIGHSLHYGHSVYDHIELSKRAQGDYGLFCDEWFLCEEWPNSWVRPVSYWKQLLDPIIDQLLDANVIDHSCVGWQLDKYNAPGNNLIAIIKYVADKLPRYIPLYTHYMNEALAWWLTNIDPVTGQNLGEIWTDEHQSIRVMDRFTWWQAMQPYLTGGHHQGDVNMALKDPATYQAKAIDTWDYFCGRTDKGTMGQSHRDPNVVRDFILTIGECTAQGQFDGKVTEYRGDQVGFILSCTTSFNGKQVGRYANGARQLDGTML